MTVVCATMRQRGGEDRATFQQAAMTPVIPEHQAPSFVSQRKQDTCALAQ